MERTSGGILMAFTQGGLEMILRYCDRNINDYLLSCRDCIQLLVRLNASLSVGWTASICRVQVLEEGGSAIIR